MSLRAGQNCKRIWTGRYGPVSGIWYEQNDGQIRFKPQDGVREIVPVQEALRADEPPKRPRGRPPKVDSA